VIFYYLERKFIRAESWGQDEKAWQWQSALHFASQFLPGTGKRPSKTGKALTMAIPARDVSQRIKGWRQGQTHFFIQKVVFDVCPKYFTYPKLGNLADFFLDEITVI
jgi:hypothetical protein